MAKKNRLKIPVRFSLFISSYFPLFLILIFRQLYTYHNYLHWGGFSGQAIIQFIKYFGMVTLFLILSFYAFVGLYFFMKNIKNKTQSDGDKIKVTDIENKNNESITYLFTYVIPFVFQDLSDLNHVVPIFILMTVAYFIYVNSSLILINPTLNWKYSLFSIEYIDNLIQTENSDKKRCMIMIKNPLLEEGDLIKVRKIGHKLFYAISIKEEKNE